MSSDPAPVNHTFKIQKLANTEPSKLRKYAKVQLYIKKRSDVSYEYFKDHWAHAHADILVSLKGFRESGILHYSQFTVDPKMQQIFKDAGLPVMEWDGCAEMWFTSIEDFFTIAKDEGFVKALGRSLKMKIRTRANLYRGHEEFRICRRWRAIDGRL